MNKPASDIDIVCPKCGRQLHVPSEDVTRNSGADAAAMFVMPTHQEYGVSKSWAMVNGAKCPLDYTTVCSMSGAELSLPH